MGERKKLSDILQNSERERLERAWASTKPADDLKPIPPGPYRCRILSGELFTASTGTPGYKIKLEVLAGEHAGRLLWHDSWLTEDAMNLAKRDLGKLGVEDFEQLERPLPRGIIVKASVGREPDDSGVERNRVRWFDVVGIEAPEPDPFAPPPEPGSTADADGFDRASGEQGTGGPTT
jgi:hypothetical protein